MTTTYTIFFFDKSACLYDFCNFYVEENESILSALEDAIYIQEELTPRSRDWRRELMTTGTTVFTYHNTVSMRVDYDWTTKPEFVTVVEE